MFNRRLTIESCCLCHVSSLQTGFPASLLMTQTHTHASLLECYFACLPIDKHSGELHNSLKQNSKKKKYWQRRKRFFEIKSRNSKTRGEARGDELRTAWSIMHLWILIVFSTRRSAQRAAAPRPLSMNGRCEGTEIVGTMKGKQQGAAAGFWWNVNLKLILAKNSNELFHSWWATVATQPLMWTFVALFISKKKSTKPQNQDGRHVTGHASIVVAVPMAHVVSYDAFMKIPLFFPSPIRKLSDYFPPFQLLSQDCCSLGSITWKRITLPSRTRQSAAKAFCFVTVKEPSAERCSNYRRWGCACGLFFFLFFFHLCRACLFLTWLNGFCGFP